MPSIRKLLGSDDYRLAHEEQRWGAIRRRILKSLAMPHVPSDFIHTSRARNVCERFMARDRSKAVRSVLIKINLDRVDPDSYIDISAPSIASYYICDCDYDTPTMRDWLAKARCWSQELREVLLIAPPPPDAVQIIDVSNDALIGLGLEQPRFTLVKVRQSFNAEAYGATYLSIDEGAYASIVRHPEADANWVWISYEGHDGWAPRHFLRIV